MSTPTRLHFKTVLLVFFMVAFGPIGNILLGKGMKGIGSLAGRSPSALLHALGQVLASGTIWLGIASLIAFFVSYMLVLSWADYSFVLPASSFAYVVVALLGRLILHESVTFTRWLGVIVICLGVFVVGQTPHSTTGAAR